MTIPRDIEANPRSLTRDILDYFWSRIGSRRGLLTLAAAGALAGIALNWSWLVAAGIAPILVAVLPCAVMCGLGLCMNRMTGGSCEGTPSDRHPGPVARPTAGLRAVPASGSVPVAGPRSAKRRRNPPARSKNNAPS